MSENMKNKTGASSYEEQSQSAISLEDLNESIKEDGFELMDGKLELSKEDYNRMELHSVLNVLTQLKYACFLIGTELTGDENLMSETIGEIRFLEKSVREGDDLAEVLKHSKLFEIGENELGSKVLGSLQIFKENNETKIHEYVFLAKKLITNGRIPIKDYVSKKNSDGYEAFSKKSLERKLMPILVTISSNSKKTEYPYGFTFDQNHRLRNDYWISISVEPEMVMLPSVFMDIIRDAALNARKYSDIGSNIFLGLKKIGNNTMISVRDEGIGIPKEDIQKIIRAGYRGSNVAKHTQGFGLGMTKMFFYVKKYGGNIFVKTVLGKGTEFKIILPTFTQ